MKLLILCCSFLIGCMQTENSSTLDPLNYGNSEIPSEVKEIFTQNCMPCHSFQAMSVSEMISDGLIIQGDSSNSQLYYRLRNSSGNNGPKNMPTWGTLTSPQIQTIQEWVDGL